ncbi:hypothetical protein NUSPORA_02683 [Nucleospora cyclopteri]
MSNEKEFDELVRNYVMGTDLKKPTEIEKLANQFYNEFRNEQLKIPNLDCSDESKNLALLLKKFYSNGPLNRNNKF